MRFFGSLLVFLFVINLTAQVDTAKFAFAGMNGKDSIWIRKPSKADFAYENGDFTTAVEEYKKLMKGDNFREYPLNLCWLYSLLHQNDSAFRYLYIATENDSTAFFMDGDMYNIVSDPRWPEFAKAQLKKAFSKLGKELPYPDIVLEFWNMSISDQAYYTEINILEKKFGTGNKGTDSLWKLKKEINAANLKRVEEIIKKHGWPARSVFGNVGANTAFLVIQHSDLKTQEKYLPLLEAACKKGEADWENFALMKDRVLVGNNKKQLYGSQVKYNDVTKKYELYPLSDPKNVDKRRASFGMMPLKDYVANWEIEFNIPQNN